MYACGHTCCCNARFVVHMYKRTYTAHVTSIQNDGHFVDRRNRLFIFFFWMLIGLWCVYYGYECTVSIYQQSSTVLSTISSSNEFDRSKCCCLFNVHVCLLYYCIRIICELVSVRVWFVGICWEIYRKTPRPRNAVLLVWGSYSLKTPHAPLELKHANSYHFRRGPVSTVHMVPLHLVSYSCSSLSRSSLRSTSPVSSSLYWRYSQRSLVGLTPLGIVDVWNWRVQHLFLLQIPLLVLLVNSYTLGSSICVRFPDWSVVGLYSQRDLHPK